MSTEDPTETSAADLPEPETGVTSQLAFNIYGAAYDIGERLSGKDTHVFLHATERNSKSIYPTGAKERQYDKIDNVDEAGLPTESEINGAPGTTQYLWIGMSPEAAMNYATAATATQRLDKKKRTKTGVTLPYDVNALRVVVPVEEEDDPRRQTKFYVLLADRGDGFAETRNIRNELVFYFEEFLTPCGKNMRERKETWNGNIRRAALKLTESTLSKNALPTNLYKPSKHIPITLPLPIRLTNEINFYLAAYGISKESWLLKHLQWVLEETNPSLGEARNTKIHALVDPQSKFTAGDVPKVIDQIKNLYDGLELDPETVCALRVGLLGTKADVPASRMKEFFLHCRKRVQRAGGRAYVDETGLVSDVLEDMSFGAGSSTLSNVPEGDWPRLVSALTSMLQELHDYNDYFRQTLRATLGDQATALAPGDVWEAFAQRSDTDSARMYVEQIARYLDAAREAKYADVGRKLEEMIKVLKTLKLM